MGRSRIEPAVGEAARDLEERLTRALGAPVCVNLTTYPAKVDGGKVLIQIG